MKVAIVGDSFVDRYCFGDVTRISPEALVPVLDVKRKEVRAGGAMNVALNVYGLGVSPTVFTIINSELGDFPFEVVSPSNCVSLVKTRFAAQNHQLLRVDEPQVYREEDICRMIYPSFSDFDIIAFVDYDKGVIQGGKATVVDTKKKDLSVFKGTKILKINRKEYSESINIDFPEAFITQSEAGINYYRDNIFVVNEPANAKEVVDVSGAGDTVMATLIYCLTNGITDPIKIMKLANKAAGIVVSRFGTSAITLKELNHE